jgi:hypothetical protein
MSEEMRELYEHCSWCGSAYVTARCQGCGADLCSVHTRRDPAKDPILAESALCPACAERRNRPVREGVGN